jgi:nucleoside-diphosphate-sugar epimerase
MQAIMTSNFPPYKKKLAEFYNNRQVLVTGGAGFIGSHIVEKLVELNAHVTVIDNLTTGNLDNLSHVLSSIIFIQDDITNFDACKKATQNKTLIFHCAAQVSVPESLEKPYLCYLINVHGTYNLLEAARINNVDRFIFSSSSAVYGTQEIPCTENMPCAPTSPYGTSKLIGELSCQLYSKQYNLKTLCLRYFNVFGSRQRDNGAYTGIIKTMRTSMNAHRSITIYGDGLQTRDFVSVEDVSNANIWFATLPPALLDGTVVNIASGTTKNIIELYNELKTEYPLYAQEPIFQPARAGDIKNSSADCTKFKTLYNIALN